MLSRTMFRALLVGGCLSAMAVAAEEKVPEAVLGRWSLVSAEGAGNLIAGELHLTAAGQSTMRMLSVHVEDVLARTVRGSFKVNNGRILYTEKRDDKDQAEKAIEYTLDQDNLTLKVVDVGATLKFKRSPVESDAALKAIRGKWKTVKIENAAKLQEGELDFAAEGDVSAKLTFLKDGASEVQEAKTRYWLVPDKYLVIEKDTGSEVMQYSLEKDTLVVQPTNAKDVRIELKRVAK